ncbi:hypothetical protein ABBQ38_008185 [Trebouxia sp. C0009 RCD-2024]
MSSPLGVGGHVGAVIARTPQTGAVRQRRSLADVLFEAFLCEDNNLMPGSMLSSTTLTMAPFPLCMSSPAAIDHSTQAMHLQTLLAIDILVSDSAACHGDAVLTMLPLAKGSSAAIGIADGKSVLEACLEGDAAVSGAAPANLLVQSLAVCSELLVYMSTEPSQVVLHFSQRGVVLSEGKQCMEINSRLLRWINARPSGSRVVGSMPDLADEELGEDFWASGSMPSMLLLMKSKTFSSLSWSCNVQRTPQCCVAVVCKTTRCGGHALVARTEHQAAGQVRAPWQTSWALWLKQAVLIRRTSSHHSKLACIQVISGLALAKVPAGFALDWADKLGQHGFVLTEGKQCVVLHSG